MQSGGKYVGTSSRRSSGPGSQRSLDRLEQGTSRPLRELTQLVRDIKRKARLARALGLHYAEQSDETGLLPEVPGDVLG